MKTIAERRRQTTARLRSVAGSLASFEADHLIGHLLSCGPTQLTLRAAESLTKAQEDSLAKLTEDRLTGRPLAYVIGHVEFFGIDLLCDPRALIPRPETEELVLVSLDHMPPDSEHTRPRVADIGTGSGNIALAIAHARKDVRVVATDIDRAALTLADENRHRHGLSERVCLVAGRSLQMFRPMPTFDLIVANPPYVALGDPYLDRSVVDFEPHVAVFAGPLGIEIVSELLVGAEMLLKPGGWIISEIGYEQSSEIRDFLKTRPAWDPPVFHRDLALVERILTVRRRP